MERVLAVKVALFILVLASTCVAQNQFAVVDSDGSVIQILGASTPATADTTCVAVVNPTWIGSPDAPLEDEYGRCVFRARDGALERIAPLWPLGAAEKRARGASLLRTADQLIGRLLILERWQATPALVAIRDRSQEASDVRARVVALTAIWNSR